MCFVFWSKFGHFSVGRCRPGHGAREMKTQGTLPIPPGHGKPPHGLLGVEPGAAWALQYPPKIRGLRLCVHSQVGLPCFCRQIASSVCLKPLDAMCVGCRLTHSEPSCTTSQVSSDWHMKKIGSRGQLGSAQRGHNINFSVSSHASGGGR